MTTDGSSCPWPGTCEPVDEARDLWVTRATGHGYTGPAGPHRHNHTACVQTAAGPVHPDDWGQPHPACGPAAHPQGLDAWPAAAYAIIAQRTTPERARTVWEAVMAEWPRPADLAVAHPDQIVAAVYPAGLAAAKTRYLQSAAVIFASHDDPIAYVQAGGAVGFGEATRRLWASTMRP